MNFSVTRMTIGGTAIIAAAAFLSAEPTVGPLVQAHGGQGGAMNRLLNDVELTAITRAEESYLPELNAVVKAREGIVEASLTSTPNSAQIRQRIQAIADAELALALRRADAFAKLKSDLHVTDPDKIEALASSVGGNVGGGRGGGGRGGAPAPAAGAARGRGN